MPRQGPALLRCTPVIPPAGDGRAMRERDCGECVDGSCSQKFIGRSV